MSHGGGVGKIRLANKRLRADVTEAITGDVPLKLTMEGASEVSITLSDPDGRIRRSSFLTQATRMSVDDRRFALAKTGKSGQNLTLTAEDLVIHRLRRKKGPKKAFRGTVTRAQFIRSLVKEASPNTRFICPELTKVQPIAGGKEPGRTTRTKRTDEDRGQGIPRNATGLTVKGSPANSTQKKVADEVIRAALRYNPPRRALLALLCAATHESVMGTLAMTPQTITDHDSVGLLQARLMYVSAKDAMSIPYNVRRFFTQPWTGTSAGGAIKQAKAGRSIAEICTSIQGNATGDVYTQWKGEAEKWLDAYTGGESGSFSTETTTTIVKPYPFEVKKGEDYWTAIKRLADEVNWRAFPVGDRFYYIAEPTLLRSRRRMLIGVNTRGVDDIDFDIDGRKRANKATLTARANLWRAPPGTVVTLGAHWGPAQGRWLVATIDGTLNKEDVSIELKRPSKPKPEPPSETSTSTKTSRSGGSSGSDGSDGADKAVKWAKKVVGVTEGSAKYNAWMSKVGGANPWCSYWIAYLMREVCGLQNLPSNYGHSSSWLSWQGATRVNKSNLKPGDILVYEWGNGGDTDHVALYIGNGRRIGGNESDRVAENPADLGRCVGAVRPKYR